jgi:hypothetical protein
VLLLCRSLFVFFFLSDMLILLRMGEAGVLLPVYPEAFMLQDIQAEVVVQLQPGVPEGFLLLVQRDQIPGLL